MSRDGKTRAKRAAELWERLNRGPQFGPREEPILPAEISRRYQGWAQSWVLAEVASLVPELRDKLDGLGNLRRSA